LKRSGQKPLPLAEPIYYKMNHSLYKRLKFVFFIEICLLLGLLYFTYSLVGRLSIAVDRWGTLEKKAKQDRDAAHSSPSDSFSS
jgi:hypothetical protein